MTPVLRLAIRVFHEVYDFIFGPLVEFKLFLFLVYGQCLLSTKFSFEIFVGCEDVAPPVLGRMSPNGTQIQVAFKPIL